MVAIITIPKKHNIKKTNKPTIVAKTFPKNFMIIYFYKLQKGLKQYKFKVKFFSNSLYKYSSILKLFC